MDYVRLRAFAEKAGALPEAGKVEISGTTISMKMSFPGPHQHIAFCLCRQLDQQVEEGMAVHPGGAVEDPSLGILRCPDLVVLPEAAMDTPHGWNPRDLALVSEIVFPVDHIDDYAPRMREYAAMGIPLYLLIDPRKGTVAVMSDPQGIDSDGRRSYRARHDYVFGDKVSVGEWTVDTSEFPRYHS
ncbi:Uma2 family endonuclease [Streptomyces sp. NPDC026206]|uniref:Uma2 family endonuclease n=1 Tax=Streptomyces sp. NPDC026206 TaxID=3157089 RepID=UPI0033EB7F9A